MGDLLDDLVNHVQKTGSPCTVVRLREQLAEDPAPDRLADFDQSLANNKVPAAVLARALRKRGYDASDWVLQRHRRGDCGCAKWHDHG